MTYLGISWNWILLWNLFSDVFFWYMNRHVFVQVGSKSIGQPLLLLSPSSSNLLYLAGISVSSFFLIVSFCHYWTVSPCGCYWFPVPEVQQGVRLALHSCDLSVSTKITREYYNTININIMADLFEVKTIYIIIKVNEISKDYKGINWIFASFSLLTYSASIFDWEIWQEFVTTITLSSRETWRETSIRSGRDFMRWNFFSKRWK